MSPVLRSAAPLTCALLLAAVPAVGCDSADSFSPSPCDVSLSELAPQEASVGDEVTATGRPFTTAYDTAVYVGTERATITAVGREGCEPCDECLYEEVCTGCDDCDACDLLCSSCEETITFLVPTLAPGSAMVRLFNRHGESNGLPLTVLGPGGDTGDTGDTGETGETGDTGDTGDTAPVETGDTAAGDTGDSAVDSGTPDTASET